MQIKNLQISQKFANICNISSIGIVVYIVSQICATLQPKSIICAIPLLIIYAESGYAYYSLVNLVNLLTSIFPRC